jgi:hypothetical protein
VRDDGLTLANPPRTARSSCCVKNEPALSISWAGFPSGQANPAKSRPFRWFDSHEPSQKPLDERNQATTTRLAPRRGRGAMAPNFGHRVWIPERRSRALRVRDRPQAGALSLNTRGTPDVSIAPLRGRMSILRSTLVALIDERRCLRNASPSYRRVKRGARARSRESSARALTRSTIRASSKRCSTPRASEPACPSKRSRARFSLHFGPAAGPEIVRSSKRACGRDERQVSRQGQGSCTSPYRRRGSFPRRRRQPRKVRQGQ